MGFISDFINAIVDPILGPLLNFNPLIAIILITFSVALLIVLLTKKFTDQNLLRRLKSEIKELQAEAKQLRDNPQEMMKVNGKMMETNMKMMTQNLRVMLFTIIPLLLLFSWLGAHFAYLPLAVGEPFAVEVEVLEGLAGNISMQIPEGLMLESDAVQTISAGKANWQLSGQEGTYDVFIQYQDAVFTKEVKISNELGEYATVEENFKNSPVKQITLSNEKLKVLNLFGWRIGWLGTYIMFSIVFNLALKRLLQVV